MENVFLDDVTEKRISELFFFSVILYLLILLFFFKLVIFAIH